jgi:hypothetical protein
MQTTLALYNLLTYAARTKKAVKLFVRPLGLLPSQSDSVTVDDDRYDLTGYRLGKEERQPCRVRIDGWLAPFWRVMEQSGWRIAYKHSLVSGEIVWTLASMQTMDDAGIPTKDALLKYVEKIRPLAGERAHRALEIAISGKVQRLAHTEDGHDSWEVRGSRDVYQTSIMAKSCTCPDAANGAPRWQDGPLCKHRIAAMFITRWEEDTGKRLHAMPPAQEENETITASAELVEYVTVARPQTSKEGWRWVHVRGLGRLSFYSTTEYPTEEAVLRVAISIAQCKAVPFHYCSNATACFSEQNYPHQAVVPALYM